MIPPKLVDQIVSPSDDPPSLQVNYKLFITTTGISVPVLRIGTFVFSGFSDIHFSLSIETTGSYVPCACLEQIHATLMPVAIRAVSRYPSDLSQVTVWNLILTTSRKALDTSSVGSLSLISLFVT
ncbi:MAG: hypothetical protein EOP04_27500 [Proteobacteria bacterium]|nr:MAG: hypothetical protein EOP04_27500 [Pseudomonadota bacterium]